MLKQYNVHTLSGKVSEGVIGSYLQDPKNLQVASVIAGFHRAFGSRNDGILMSLDIIGNIKDDSLISMERNLLVWNLYMLTSEFIEEGMYDKAMEFLSRAEYNWSRDVVLGDDLGVYHVSWLEQLWHKRAEIFFLLGDEVNFINECNKIMASRDALFLRAEELTGESMLLDRCSYSCLEIQAFSTRKSNIEKALELLEYAIVLKGADISYLEKHDAKDSKHVSNPEKQYWNCLKYFYSLDNQPFDNIRYTYCASCKYYEKGFCKIHQISVDEFKCCSKYRN
jgi:hypothetical protein